MFTGIITDIGTIRSREDRGDTRLIIGTVYDTGTIDLGASIACSGACLTVVDKGADEAGPWFAIDASAETLACTAPGMWDAGRRLNLERALKVGDELGGHIVTGHVDAVGKVVSVVPVGDSVTVTIAAPATLAAHIAPKGSITVDGVSLTVNDVTDQPSGEAHFTLNIIPHTQAMTTLDEAAAGRPVNLEIDILARYLARMQARG
ncbi:riboflavin synthase [Sphingopyxis witflariensis]|uniref:Riboflavin synthase n=1 Tax=Sphingopyxis witflariensis TaxID=173675 RepID=A0A2D0AMM8_9SPHN|nr:riboflavin synthase [Sphingopyxis witflariensis]OWQ94438.1 riboflavin synthase [Sphingopyxis witflariensis]